MRKYKQHQKGFCQKCGKVNERNCHRWCIGCHNEYMREWRKLHPLNEEQRKKDRCRSYASVYLRRGKLKKEKCLVCGSENSQMHHKNYNEPLNIVWLCRSCHLKVHKT